MRIARSDWNRADESEYGEREDQQAGQEAA
jgi:hypothetical protein